MKNISTITRHRWSLKQSTRQRLITLKPIHLLLVCLLLTGSLSLAFGQEVKKGPANKSPLITASVVADGVRISAPGEVVQLRLEVYDLVGQKLLDTQQRGGNVLDWNLERVAGERVADGTYLCVVTMKDPSGQLTQKVGWVSVSGQSASLRPAAVADLSPQQAQTVGPIAAGDEGLVLIPAEDAAPFTLVTHTGEEAQLTRTRGALSFRMGDFFSHKDTEQMRLTEDGNLGVGTDKPQAKLDVAGEIRARGGIRFDDGTLLTSARTSVLANNTGKPVATNSDSPTPNASGAGTSSRLAKWLDSAGTLGDSAITEANGNIGIGNSNPVSTLHIGGFGGYGATTGLLLGNNLTGTQYDRAVQVAPVQVASPLSNSVLLYTLPTLNPGVTVPNQFGLAIDEKQGAGSINSFAAILTGRGPSLGATNNTHLLMGSLAIPNGNFGIYDNTGSTNYFKGSIGINTTAPTQKLEVAGNLKISGTGNGLIFPDGSKQTTASTGGGGSMTGSQIVTAVNDPATTGTINDNRLSPNVARLNTANTFNGNQTVNGDISTTGPTAMVNVAGGVVISCGDRFVQCFNVKNNTLTVQPASQRVGIGVADPQNKLSVAGTVQSTTGGFVFPDGTTQSTATGTAYTTTSWTDTEITPWGSGVDTTLLTLNLPPGNYMVTATVQFENKANNFLQDNTRLMKCSFFPVSNTEPFWDFRLGALSTAGEALPLTFTTVFNNTGFPLEFYCLTLSGTSDRSWVYAKRRRMTAVRLGDVITQ